MSKASLKEARDYSAILNMADEHIRWLQKDLKDDVEGAVGYWLRFIKYYHHLSNNELREIFTRQSKLIAEWFTRSMIRDNTVIKRLKLQQIIQLLQYRVRDQNLLNALNDHKQPIMRIVLADTRDLIDRKHRVSPAILKNLVLQLQTYAEWPELAIVVDSIEKAMR